MTIIMTMLRFSSVCVCCCTRVPSFEFVCYCNSWCLIYMYRSWYCFLFLCCSVLKKWGGILPWNCSCRGPFVTMVLPSSLSDLCCLISVLLWCPSWTLTRLVEENTGNRSAVYLGVNFVARKKSTRHHSYRLIEPCKRAHVYSFRQGFVSIVSVESVVVPRAALMRNQRCLLLHLLVSQRMCSQLRIRKDIYSPALHCKK